MINTNAFKYAAYYKAKEEDEKQKFEEESKLRQLAQGDEQLEQGRERLGLTKRQLGAEEQARIDEFNLKEKEKLRNRFSAEISNLARESAKASLQNPDWDNSPANQKTMEALDGLIERIGAFDILSRGQATMLFNEVFDEQRQKTLENVNVTQGGGFIDNTGRNVTADEMRERRARGEPASNFRPAPNRTETGEAGAFSKATLTNKNLENFQTTERATVNFVKTASRLQQLEDADLADVNKVAGIAAGLRSEGLALFNAFASPDGTNNEGLTYQEISNVDRYNDKLEEMGIAGTEAKSLFFNLALAYAGAIGLGEGRALTDKDVRLAMDAVGTGGFKSPASKRASVDMATSFVVEKYKTYRDQIERNSEVPLSSIPTELQSYFEGKGETPEPQPIPDIIQQTYSILDSTFPDTPIGTIKEFQGVKWKKTNDGWDLVEE